MHKTMQGYEEHILSDRSFAAAAPFNFSFKGNKKREIAAAAAAYHNL